MNVCNSGTGFSFSNSYIPRCFQPREVGVPVIRRIILLGLSVTMNRRRKTVWTFEQAQGFTFYYAYLDHPELLNAVFSYFLYFVVFYFSALFMVCSWFALSIFLDYKGNFYQSLERLDRQIWHLNGGNPSGTLLLQEPNIIFI